MANECEAKQRAACGVWCAVCGVWRTADGGRTDPAFLDPVTRAAVTRIRISEDRWDQGVKGAETEGSQDIPNPHSSAEKQEGVGAV